MTDDLYLKDFTRSGRRKILNFHGRKKYNDLKYKRKSIFVFPGKEENGTERKQVLKEVEQLAVNEDTESQLVIERDSFDELKKEIPK